MMMPLLVFAFLVVFSVVTSQDHDVNLQTPYSEMTRKRSLEATTPFPSASTVENGGTQLELTPVETLLMKKLDNLTMVFGGMSQCGSVPVVQNSEILEAKVETLGKKIQELMDASRNLSADVYAMKQNVSSLIDVTRSSNSELQQNFNNGLQELKDLQTATSTSSHLNLTLDKQYPRNCREVREKTASGIYKIQPEGAPKPFEVVCDLETMGGGWTVIQRRFDGSQDFYLDWQNYKNGFGNLGGEFWIGLENIHLLTGFEGNELLIELGDFKSQNKSALYSKFSIGTELEGYSLKASFDDDYSEDGGDSLSYYTGKKFSTKDNDQDDNPEINWAEYHHGGWWYLGYEYSNLNGKYVARDQAPGSSVTRVFWYTFNGNYDSLRHTRMLVRPKV